MYPEVNEQIREAKLFGNHRLESSESSGKIKAPVTLCYQRDAGAICVEKYIKKMFVVQRLSI